MTISRRNFLASTTAAAAAAMTSSRFAPRAAEEASQPPNVLFILADQWRASALGIGSDEVVRTPHIDKFAGQGVHFTRAYAANPVCTPNRSCILTGRHSHQHGMITNNLMLPPQEVTWPERFAQAGYDTHYIGKWHMDGEEKPGFVPPGWRRRGFRTFEGFNRGHNYHSPWGFDNDGGPIDDQWTRTGEPYYEPVLQTDLAIRFMKQQRKAPFACYLSWGPPHTPFRPPAKFDRYTTEDIRLRPNVPKAHEDQARKDLAGYYGLCESLDHEMGRITRFLEESGLAENTLVILTADHGELAGSHGKYRKSEPEDESLSVPLLMRLPGVLDGGRQSDALVNSIDLMPTMLRLCGLEDPGTCTGQDLSSVIRNGGRGSGNDAVCCEGKVSSSPGDGEETPRRNRRRNNAEAGSWRSVVTDRYKLTVVGDWDNIAHLIDLKNDPFEMENLAGQASHRRVQDELLTALRDNAEATGDTFPLRPQAAEKMYSDEAAAARG